MMKGRINTYLNIRSGKPEVLPDNNPNDHFYKPGDEIEIAERVIGEEYKGNNIWFKLTNGTFVWSGGVVKINTPTSDPTPFMYDAAKVARWSRLSFDVSKFWHRTTGKDITIAVIDTGIFPHQDLKEAIDTNYQKSFISDSVQDDDGHGTHVSGIIAARGNSDVYGVAPAAKILPLKVVNTHTDTIGTQKLIDAITYALSLEHVKIINLSLIANSNDKTGMPALNSVLQQAVHSGKIVVAASGNLAGNYISSPAKFENIISVSAVKQDINSQVESYVLIGASNFGTGIKTCCPGSDITSCNASDTGTRELSGTSMACAYMSGLIALKLQQVSDLNAKDQFSVLQAIKSSVFQYMDVKKNSLPVINPALFINF